MLEWGDKVRELERREGRRLTLGELMREAAKHQMSEREVKAQRESWVRGMSARCEHGWVDYEQCPQCRQQAG